MRPVASEQVGVAWVKTIPFVIEQGLNNSVSVQRPAPDRWEKPSYIQVNVEDSQTFLDSPMRAPILVLDIWTKDTRWDRCIDLASTIVDETYYHTTLGIPPDAKHYGAKVTNANAVTSEPIRLTGDEEGLAHVRVRVQLFWTSNEGKVYAR